MIPLKTIEDLINKHSSLEKDLSSGELDKKLFAEKSKEYSDVNEIVGNAKDYISFQAEKEELEKISQYFFITFFFYFSKKILIRTFTIFIFKPYF